MAGVYEPTLGIATSCGRISPIFDIAVGIDGDLSGYDNIRLRGMLLGLGAGEIESYVPDIADFTGLGDYLDLPVRTYSSSMMTRLTFAVATCFSPEILLMGEWIMAGDASFLAKAQHRIESFVERANIVVLASTISTSAGNGAPKPCGWTGAVFERQARSRLCCKRCSSTLRGSHPRLNDGFTRRSPFEARDRRGRSPRL